MRTKLCDQFGIEFPIFAFSHCRDVVAAVSKAGGFMQGADIPESELRALAGDR